MTMGEKVMELKESGRHLKSWVSSWRTTDIVAEILLFAVGRIGSIPSER